MATFDIYLLPKDERSVTPNTVRAALNELPLVPPNREDPARLVYRNPDTTVHFSVLLNPELIADEDEPLDLVNTMIPDHVDVLSESSSGYRVSSRTEDYEQDEDEDEDDEDPHELPPITVHVPLFVPTFFLVESIQVVEALAAATELDVAVTISGDADADEQPEPATRAEVLASWERVHRHCYEKLGDKQRLQLWDEEKCAHFYDYGIARAQLQEELTPDGVEVIPIQPARHEGETKTLCVWRSDQPSLIPRTDLILVQRVGRPRGLLRRKKVDEMILPTEAIWKILSPFAESRYEPIPMLLYRNTQEPPAQLLTDIEELQGEPVDKAKRTELVGVTDLELGEKE
ncbi:MAG: hypothetical protein MK538_10685 [Planctomycetes bacterium]|nr:hypothetical protein [Planctomycetota bacterium]